MFTSRLIRFYRTYIRGLLKGFLYIAFCLAVIIIGSNPTAAVYLWLILCIPAALALIVVAAFAIYHGVKHGDPSIDYSLDPVIVRHTTHGTVHKKELPFCPICKRNSACRVGYNPYTKMRWHVVR